MHSVSRFLLAIALVTTAAPAGCHEPSGGRPFDGTLGDAMVEFVAAIEGLSADLAGVDDIADCRAVKPSIERRMRLLRRLSPIVASLGAETWKGMPQGIVDRRDEALRAFNREAVRVLLDRERAAVLREVVGEAPPLIYLDYQRAG
jgi:hypothetical protein